MDVSLTCRGTAETMLPAVVARRLFRYMLPAVVARQRILCWALKCRILTAINFQ